MQGVLYSHRSNFLHAMKLGLANGAALSATDTALVLVPLYHANSWGLAFACPMMGARMILPGGCSPPNPKACSLNSEPSLSLLRLGFTEGTKAPA